MTSISGTKAFYFLKAPNHFEIFCFTNQLKYFEWQRSAIHKLFASWQFTKKWKAPKKVPLLKTNSYWWTITSSLIKVLWKNYRSNILFLQQDFRVVSLRLVNPLTPKSDQHATSPWTRYENVQTYLLEFVVMILHQILITNLQGNV